MWTVLDVVFCALPFVTLAGSNLADWRNCRSDVANKWIVPDLYHATVGQHTIFVVKWIASMMWMI
jgi:hypothetical protein